MKLFVDCASRDHHQTEVTLFLSFLFITTSLICDNKHMEAWSMFEIFHLSICFHRHCCWTESESFPGMSDEMIAADAGSV